MGYKAGRVPARRGFREPGSAEALTSRELDCCRFLAIPDALGVCQIDVPPGVGQDRVRLHNGSRAPPIGIETEALVKDDHLASAAVAATKLQALRLGEHDAI